MSDLKKFSNECKNRINRYKLNSTIFKRAMNFFEISHQEKYTYNFQWLGMPIIQFPQDMLVTQEIIYETRPNIIIETGVARGGSLIMYSSLLSLIHSNYCVIGIDIDIRKHNRNKIKKHKFSKNVELVQGHSNNEVTLDKLKKLLKSIKIKNKKIMVCLDSNHTHEHVLKELEAYKEFVSKNCYLVVFDTTINLLSNNKIANLTKNYHFKPFGKESNPHSAVKKFLKTNKNFKIDKTRHQKAVITNCYEGFLKKI